MATNTKKKGTMTTTDQGQGWPIFYGMGFGIASAITGFAVGLLTKSPLLMILAMSIIVITMGGLRQLGRRFPGVLWLQNLHEVRSWPMAVMMLLIGMLTWKVLSPLTGSFIMVSSGMQWWHILIILTGVIGPCLVITLEGGRIATAVVLIAYAFTIILATQVIAGQAVIEERRQHQQEQQQITDEACSNDDDLFKAGCSG